MATQLGAPSWYLSTVHCWVATTVQLFPPQLVLADLVFALVAAAFAATFLVSVFVLVVFLIVGFFTVAAFLVVVAAFFVEAAGFLVVEVSSVDLVLLAGAFGLLRPLLRSGNLLCRLSVLLGIGGGIWPLRSKLNLAGGILGEDKGLR